MVQHGCRLAALQRVWLAQHQGGVKWFYQVSSVRSGRAHKRTTPPLCEQVHIVLENDIPFELRRRNPHRHALGGGD